MREKRYISICIAVLLVTGCKTQDEDVIIIRASDLEDSDLIESVHPTVKSMDTTEAVYEETINIDTTEAVCEETISIDTPEPVIPETEVQAQDTAGMTELQVEVPEGPRNLLAIEVNGSIYGSLSGLLEDSDVLGAHIVRCMWWDADPWSGMSAGDSIIVLFDADYTTRENQVVSLRYIPKTGTQNHPFSIYVFHKTGDNYPSFFYADGTESTKLLDNLPLATFEEVTGIFGELRAGRIHAGVDFKAPAGTPVWTAHGGVVTRVNWNYSYNGNCVEVDIGNGHKEIFLHMQDIAQGIIPGVILRKGDPVGSVGNTGRTSTASHLHYQINDENDEAVDPYEYFSWHRRRLSDADMEEFIIFRDYCEIWMSDE